jgi:cytoskeletal protein RodZ
MERPGEYLKRERVLRDVSLESVHEATRVSIKFLVALEADDHEVLPHPAFVKGFIQSYAKHLGLDETEAVLRYELFLREKFQQEKSEPPKGWQTADSGSAALKNSRTIQILVAVGVVVIVILYLFSFREGADEASSIPQTRLPEVATSEVEAVPDKFDAESDVHRAAAVVEPPAPVQQVPAQPIPKKHTLVVKAKEDVWIEVVIDGREPFDVLLKVDERVVWKASEEFSLVIGNAGGVALEFDGEDIQLYGESGRVVRLRLPNKNMPAANAPAPGSVPDPADNF